MTFCFTDCFLKGDRSRYRRSDRLKFRRIYQVMRSLMRDSCLHNLFVYVSSNLPRTGQCSLLKESRGLGFLPTPKLPLRLVSRRKPSSTRIKEHKNRYKKVLNFHQNNCFPPGAWAPRLLTMVRIDDYL